MRRRLGILLPIVLLAVLVQLMAPIAAFRVVAAAVTDPLYMAAMCSGMASSAVDDSQTPPASATHDAGDCCVACAAGHGGGVAAAPPEPVFVSLQRLYQTVSWPEALAPLSSSRVGSNAQARAPPLSA